MNNITQNIVYIFAHNDDEIFILPSIKEELEKQNKVFVVYITYGSQYGHDHTTRKDESLKTLLSIGVNSANIFPVGTELNVLDGESYRFMNQIYEKLLNILSFKIEKIFVPAWEGGHLDHDVAQIIGMEIFKQKEIPSIIEYPLYNGFQCIGPFFRVMNLIPRKNEEILSLKLSYREILQIFLTVFNYKSQWKTFLGLFPFIILKLLVFKKYNFRRNCVYDYGKPPHSGPLFYEKRFGASFNDLSKKFREFIDHQSQST